MRMALKQIEVVDDKVAEILRKKTPAEKLKLASDMWKSARNMLNHHLKNIHPDWDKEKIQREIVKRMSNKQYMELHTAKLRDTINWKLVKQSKKHT